jgi:hypothetical protein
MLPFVAGWHRFGVLRMAGLDEPEERSQSLDEPEAPLLLGDLRAIRPNEQGC